MRRGTVFIGDDHVLGEILDEVADTLARRGHRVVRGPAQPPPARTVYPPDTWPRLFAAAEVLVVSTRTAVPAELLAASPRVRGVVFPSIGTESVDLAAATRLGVVVAHGATDENCRSMAEATVMLAAGLLLQLPLRQREFNENVARPAPSAITSRMMSGHTVGLLGFGRIAKEVVRRLDGWGVRRVLACTRHPADHGDWPQVTFTDLGTVLEQSDVLSVHLPLTQETAGLIGAAELSRMKPGSVLVNTARGGIVDETALARALSQGRLAGAAVDTFVQEPPPPDHPLRACPTALLTNHIIGHTRELFDSLAPVAVEHVQSILDGRPPRYVRNPEVLSHPHRHRHTGREAGIP
ncbi:dehydrogenase [Streptomyces samsunensis]|uniref:Dehydrogenase n=1 Tax=Streptomyces malaysiensis TaxID=92644 RepID=A0ABX6WJC2_STRMQ|nr:MULTISPECIES: NAD(P)-dependent oxidoreductase [Streptomyces]NUH39712.1 dehydrogenase [Streptomyces samsunensis]QPI61223.1 dehydrogenase [Streptomyces solisilvae]UHH22983.1 D-2-hydroxyacid dehydrogenase family protein [Streptomyces sp. HNM0561]